MVVILFRDGILDEWLDGSSRKSVWVDRGSSRKRGDEVGYSSVWAG